jgi:hypothetical protein
MRIAVGMRIRARHVCTSSFRESRDDASAIAGRPPGDATAAAVQRPGRGSTSPRRAVASLIAEFLFAFDPDRIIATRAVAG